jgi:argininosuccinate synthase
MAERDTVVLAYSGGLDTSVAVTWIRETYDLDVITLTIDLGTNEDLESIRGRAIEVGAVKALVMDAGAPFVEYFIWPALRAGALYEGVYPLATALGRPLIAKLLVDTARQEGAKAVAHGCTGTKKSPYSTDENLWGRSIECGVLEDPWAEPPEDAYALTVNPADAPDEAEYVEIDFEVGVPVALNGEAMGGVELIRELDVIAGRHGIGRIDHIENRVVGIKSREIYEAPAAVVLHAAHKALEAMTMTRPALRFKESVSVHYADMIYDGLWFSKFHQDLAAYVLSSQQIVNGKVKMRLFKGQAVKAGLQSEYSLYSKALATYDKGDLFDHKAALGFIALHGLPTRTQAQVLKTALPEETVRPQLSPPEIKPQ